MDDRRMRMTENIRITERKKKKGIREELEKEEAEK